MIGCNGKLELTSQTQLHRLNPFCSRTHRNCCEEPEVKGIVSLNNTLMCHWLGWGLPHVGHLGNMGAELPPPPFTLP
jgi:hypothetical protein